jgi:hypothetical protein
VCVCVCLPLLLLGTPPREGEGEEEERGALPPLLGNAAQVASEEKEAGGKEEEEEEEEDCEGGVVGPPTASSCLRMYCFSLSVLCSTDTMFSLVCCASPLDSSRRKLSTPCFSCLRMAVAAPPSQSVPSPLEISCRYTRRALSCVRIPASELPGSQLEAGLVVEGEGDS